MKSLKDFKFLQIGLGSMGKRRIRNLLFHGVSKEHIFGFDTRLDRNKEVAKAFGIKTFKTFEEAIHETQPDAYLVSTPPDVHYKYFLHAARHKKHLFVEHPVTDKGYKELFSLMDGSFVAAPSCTLRFHPAIKLLKKTLEGKKIGTILSFQYHLGQYLPSWHPWEDFREVYFSKKFTGACREMFGFELVWLTPTLNLGDVSYVIGTTEKLSNLKMTADDRYSALVKFKSRISGTIVIDLLSRKPFRTLRVVGREGVLEWEWQENQVKVFDVTSSKTEIIKLRRGKSLKQYVTTEDMYEEEIASFLNAIQKKSKYPYTFSESLDHLKALFALERSAKLKKLIQVK